MNRATWAATADSIEDNGGTFRAGDLQSLKGSPFLVCALFPGDDRVITRDLEPSDISHFCEDFFDHLTNPDRGIGTWKRENVEGKPDAWVLDVVELFPLDAMEDALKAAKDRGQDGIFDLSTGTYIPTP